ncbi:MAG TPA: hypothetical protein VFO72_07305 [Pyrinomonadaceae bacterium]|nr:hypothetical protein [Pyrinomonadaceae bacterium]
MSKLRWAIACGAFLLTTFVGIGFVLLQNSAAAAQESQTERVVKGDHRRLPVFQIEVLVDGRPLAPRYERGRLYVNAVQGAEYELRLRNSSTERVAVALSVDGLNTIDARQTSAWNASKWVIEPHQTITISGWQMSSERARRFYFTNEHDSYVRKLGRKANIGVISAVFFRERRRVMPVTKGPVTQENSPAPAESQLRAEASRDSRAATGIGRSVRNEVSWIDMELDPKAVAELIVRYEYSDSRYCPEPK